MPQIHVRLQPNIYAALSGVVREQKLKGGLSELCGSLITRFVLDGFEFSKLDSLAKRVETIADAVARIESAPTNVGLTSEQDQLLRVLARASAKITQLLESAGGQK
jgi:hypothetical protein